MGVKAVGNELVSELEPGLEDVEQYSESAEAVQSAPRKAKLEFFLHRRYRLPQRPDVEIDRKLWLSAAEGKRQATV